MGAVEGGLGNGQLKGEDLIRAPQLAPVVQAHCGDSRFLVGACGEVRDSPVGDRPHGPAELTFLAHGSCRGVKRVHKSHPAREPAPLYDHVAAGREDQIL